MTTKPTILVFVDWFWPGFLAGGPVQSVVSLVNYLHKDFHFKIITTNADIDQIPYHAIQPNTWTRSALNCDVFYAEPSKLNKAFLKSIVDSTSFDVVYINSFFSKFFSIVPLQILNASYHNKPVVFAPRGMLGEGALAIKKYKKKAFIFCAKAMGLHSRVIWQATSEQEEQEIRKIMNPKTRIVRLSNLPKKLDATEKVKETGMLNACFVSRISEKKNLEFALKILGRIRDFRINYNIYGPLEDLNYWGKCESLITAMPPNVRVAYMGPVSPEKMEATFAQEQVLFLPTLNENFGHAIVEALQCGCPAVISDQTPWTDLEAHNAGYAIALRDEQAFVDALIQLARLDQAQFSEKSNAAIKYISAKIDLDGIVRQYKDLFDDCTKN